MVICYSYKLLNANSNLLQLLLHFNSNLLLLSYFVSEMTVFVGWYVRHYYLILSFQVSLLQTQKSTEEDKSQ